MKCSDPLGPWYESHLTAEGARGFKAENWNFFTINHDASSKFDVQEKEININGIDDWASQKVFSYLVLLPRTANKVSALFATAWYRSSVCWDLWPHCVQS
jgi:hypothetical protein